MKENRPTQPNIVNRKPPIIQLFLHSPNFLKRLIKYCLREQDIIRVVYVENYFKNVESEGIMKQPNLNQSKEKIGDLELDFSVVNGENETFDLRVGIIRKSKGASQKLRITFLHDLQEPVFELDHSQTHGQVIIPKSLIDKQNGNLEIKVQVLW